MVQVRSPFALRRRGGGVLTGPAGTLRPGYPDLAFSGQRTFATISPDMSKEPNLPAADSAQSSPNSATVERRDADRREASNRRSGFDRRRGPGRRRTDYRRDAEEGHMNEEQLAFILAVDEYKRVNDRPFPSWTEILDLLLYLGYRKVAPVGEFKLSKGRQTPRRDAAEEEDGEE